MTAKIKGVDACVFDAYGTLFDVAAAASHCQADIGAKWADFSKLWRDKQLQYTWLRSLMGRYVPFWQVTQDALDYAMSAFGMNDRALRQKLLDIYFKLDAYPEVPDMLKKLKAGGLKTATLSNGSPDMLKAAVDNAGIKATLDRIQSVDVLKIFKPDPRVYQLACDDLGVPAERICFMSSNAWDAWAGAEFGYQVVWVNRFDQPPEKLPSGPKAVIKNLAELPPLLGL